MQILPRTHALHFGSSFADRSRAHAAVAFRHDIEVQPLINSLGETVLYQVRSRNVATLNLAESLYARNPMTRAPMGAVPA